MSISGSGAETLVCAERGVAAGRGVGAPDSGQWSGHSSVYRARGGGRDTLGTYRQWPKWIGDTVCSVFRQFRAGSMETSG